MLYPLLHSNKEPVTLISFRFLQKQCQNSDSQALSARVKVLIVTLALVILLGEPTVLGVILGLYWRYIRLEPAKATSRIWSSRSKDGTESKTSLMYSRISFLQAV